MRILLIVLLLALSGTAFPVPVLRKGTYRGSSYALTRIDPRAYRLEVLTYGRQGKLWTGAFRSLEALPKECLAALNGTFFSLRWNEPAGPLVYDGGRQQWTPRFKRDGRAVSSLARWYLAVYADGRATLGNSQGRSAEQLRARLEPPALRSLLGGGGCLVRGGLRAISQQTLASEGFDERSGLRPQAAVPRTAVGLARDGQVLLATVGLEGGGLSLQDFADLLVSLGAQEAIFLDCGSSTAMRVGNWQGGAGRPCPTWLVVLPHSQN